MKAVQVRYTVKPEYVEQNKANIRKVMAKLKAEPVEGMQYSTYILEDGQTFVHINMAKDDETMSKLGNLQEFKDFRMGLKASEPISPPRQTKLHLVAAGFEL